MPKPPRPPKPHDDAPAAFAARMGVSVKALRVYERAGLIRPKRTQAGWRVFDDQCAERLAAILALKDLGLTLQRIRALLEAPGVDLEAVLAVQEAALAQTRERTTRALSAVRAARKTLAQGRRLSPDDLAHLVRRTMMTKSSNWPPAFEDVAKKVYTQEQLDAFAQQPQMDAAEQARVQNAWAQIFADIDALAGQAPTSPAGLEIGRRALTLIQEFTQGSQERWNGAARFWQEAFKDPTASAHSPMNPAHWAFLQQAFAALNTQGELKP